MKTCTFFLILKLVCLLLNKMKNTEMPNVENNHHTEMITINLSVYSFFTVYVNIFI